MVSRLSKQSHFCLGLGAAEWRKMDEILKNNEVGGEATNEAEILAQEPSFEEHMAEKEHQLSEKELEARKEQQRIKEIVASEGLEDISTNTIHYKGKKIIQNQLGNKEQALYNIEKRKIIEKIFVGDEAYMQQIENPDNLSEKQKSLTKEALEDMIEFGTFTIFDDDAVDHEYNRGYNHLFARYLNEECDGVGPHAFIHGRIRNLEDWSKKETPDDLLELFNKYDIDVNDETVKEKALNGFVRTLTYGTLQYGSHSWLLYRTLMPGDTKFGGTYGPLTNQAKWYYETFALGKLQEAIGENKIGEYIEKFKNQFPKSTEIWDKEKRKYIYAGNAFDYCTEQFKNQYNIKGELFNQ